MKKIFAGMLLAALPAAALADGRVYGLLDIGLIGGFDRHIPASANDLRHNWYLGNGSGMRHNYTSRLGIEAFEDLGGGNRIEARIEGTLDALHTFYFDRHAYIGVAGGFGTLRLGRTRDLINGAASRFDPFGNDGLVEDKILLAQLGGIGQFRLPRAVTWTSPVVDGMQATVQFGARATSADANSLKLLLTYDAEQWGVHAGVDMAGRELQSNGYYRFGPRARNVVAGAHRRIGSVKLGGQLLHAYRDMDGIDVDPAFARDANPWGWIATARLPVTGGEFKLVMVSTDQVVNKLGTLQPIREIGGGYEHYLSKSSMLYLQVGHERRSGGGHWHAGLLTRF